MLRRSLGLFLHRKILKFYQSGQPQAELDYSDNSRALSIMRRERQDLFLEFLRSENVSKMAVACSVWKLGSSLLQQIKHRVISFQKNYSMKYMVSRAQNLQVTIVIFKQ